MPTQLLTVKDVAQLLRESEWTVRERLRRGEIKGIRLGGTGPWRVTEKAYEAYLKRCES